MSVEKQSYENTGPTESRIGWRHAAPAASAMVERIPEEQPAAAASESSCSASTATTTSAEGGVEPGLSSSPMGQSEYLVHSVV